MARAASLCLQPVAAGLAEQWAALVLKSLMSKLPAVGRGCIRDGMLVLTIPAQAPNDFASKARSHTRSWAQSSVPVREAAPAPMASPLSYVEAAAGARAHEIRRPPPGKTTDRNQAPPARIAPNWNPLQHPQPVNVSTIETAPLR